MKKNRLLLLALAYEDKASEKEKGGGEMMAGLLHAAI